MEFRCRLGTAGGRSSRASTSPRARRTCAASSKTRACTSCRWRRAARVPGPVARPARRISRARVPDLQPGAGDAAQGRHAAGAVARHPAPAGLSNPTFKAVLDDVHEKVRGGTALSDAFARARRPVLRRLHGVADGRRAQRQPRHGAPPLRRLREGHRHGAAQRTISALIYPAILVTMLVGLLVGIIVVKVVPAFSDFYASFDQELPLVDADHRRASRTSCAPTCCCSSWLLVGGGRGVRDLGAAARASAPASTGWLLRLPMRRARSRTSSPPRRWRARWRRCSAAASRWSTRSTPRRRRPATAISARELGPCAERVREGRGFAAALLERGVLPDVAVKMVEVGESTGALQEMLNSPRGLLRRGHRDRGRPVRHAGRAGACWWSWASSSPAWCWRSTCRSSSCRSVVGR